MTEPALPHLVLPLAVRLKLESHALEGMPAEVCGILLGSSCEGRVLVQRALPARNRNREQPNTRYDLDPTDLLAGEEAAREAGQGVVGIYHSHPEQPALPSELDRSGAWTGWSYVIVSVAGEQVQDLRAWRLAGGRFQEQAVLPDEPA